MLLTLGHTLKLLLQRNINRYARNNISHFPTAAFLFYIFIMRIIAFLTCLIASSPVMAQVLPPAAYFNGVYELAGRGPGHDGSAMLDWVTLLAETDADDARIMLRSCRSGEGYLERTSSSIEGASPLVGHLADWQLFCRFTNDSDNYPRLSCYAVAKDDPDTPGILALWPAHWDKPAHAVDCD